MTTTNLFNIELSNSYAGDAFAELVRVYNLHRHKLATPANFLGTKLAVGSQVGFLGISQSSADPFSEIGSIAPLTVIAIGTDTLTLSRPSNATTLGSLTYRDPAVNAFKTIEGLKARVNENIIVFDLTKDRSGFVDESFLARAATRSATYDTKIDSVSLVTVPTVPTTNALTVTINAQGYYQVSSYTQFNPTISLVRGQSYSFTSTPSVITAGGFNIVADLQDPVRGLNYYTQHVTVSNNLVTFSVPYDAPSQLFYQSALSPYIYGQINITGGTNLPSLTTQQAWQAAASTIPIDEPIQTIGISLSALGPYRISRWELLPQWQLPNADKDVYLQLQYTTDFANRFPLSALIRLQTLAKTTIDAQLSTAIIPAEAYVYCAVYSPFNLQRLVQQLTLIDTI